MKVGDIVLKLDLVVFDSKTGNVERFAARLAQHDGLTVMNVKDIETVDRPFVMITHTTGTGRTPDTTQKFLKQNSKFLKGVCSSGNRNWGPHYAKAADNISSEFGVPIVSKFELSGNSKVASKIIEFMEGF